DSAVRGASGLAQRFGLSPFRTGLLLISFATSVPALAVNAYAFAVGQTEMTLGNIIGGNIAGIGLVLALAALFAPLLLGMRLLAAEAVFVLVASGVLLMFGLDGSIGRWEGAALLAGFLAYLAFVFRRADEESATVQKELAEFSVTSTGLVQNLIRIAFAGGLLFFGSRLVVDSAPQIGLALGLDPMRTGLLVVAIGTALPSIVATAISARNGHGNVVAGQVLGACLFNVLFIVGALAVLRPLELPGSFVTLQLPGAMAFALLLYPVLGGELKLAKRESGWLLLAFSLWLGIELLVAFG
ncbi:MAG: sodium:calcium antiporter, partial [Arenimonas sp.]|nr:sodium:calcium antiporter [Arenimonas sp.]